METEKLQKKVEKAKEAVKDLEEPLKTKAFEIILNKLLSEGVNQQQIQNPNTLQKEPENNYDSDVGDQLSNTIDSTAYPIIYQLKKALDKSLYVLLISKNDHSIDGLNPSQISKILSVKFRIPTTANSISMVLMKAGNFVDRKQVATTGGSAYQYRIMHAGEQYIQNILNNPPSEVVARPTRKKSTKSGSSNKPRKTKKGLKERILSLKDESFFEKPKEAKEIKEELEVRGFHYNYEPVCVALLRLVKKGIFRRIKEVKGKKTIYKYCNP